MGELGWGVGVDLGVVEELGLLETLARWAQEGALSGGQGAVGLSHQVRVGPHHGLPAGGLHHIRSMAICKREREREGEG